MKIFPNRLSEYAAIAAGVVVVGLIIATVAVSENGRIVRGVRVSGVEVGGLTRAAVSNIIRDWSKDQAKTRIILTALNTHWNGSFAGLGGRIDWKSAVDRAYMVGRAGNPFHRLACCLTPYGAGKRFDAPLVINEARLARTIDKVAKAIDRPHKDARIHVSNNMLDVEQDDVGIKVDRPGSVRVIARALLRGQLIAELPVVADKPNVVAADAAHIDTLLARYVTAFIPARQDRSHNLTLAARSVDGVIIKPGDVFSYNTTVGPRLESRGFREAPIFIRGKVEPGVGGEICRVPSTLYNTALLAGLKVMARSHHSQKVVYVPVGRDATVAFGLRDLKFRNTNSAPVAIVSKVQRGRLTVDVYGSAADKKNVEVFTGPVTYVKPGVEVVSDPAVQPGRRKVEEHGVRGASVIVYRKITSEDGTSVTETISRDRYLPQDTLIGVGSGGNPTKTGASPHAQATKVAGDSTKIPVN